MIEPQESFGYWLRRRRKALDLTQAQLAVRAGCVLTTIKKIETGTRHPSRQLSARLADALVLSSEERAMLLRAADASARPEPPSPHTPLRTAALPTLPYPPIGREQEIAALQALVLDTRTHLITLTGPGGVGKTHLALHLVNLLQDAFADGVWFIDLTSLNHPEGLPATMARALGLESHLTPLEALSQVLRDQHTLIVLDNFEQVLAAAPVIAQLLAAAPALTLLVTSRAPLHLTYEQTYAVSPLALPPEQNAHPAATYPAVQLFVRHARAARQDFELTPQNEAAVAAICRHLDGLPLAIQLAAARVRLFEPTALLRRLDRRLNLLTGGPHDLPARQQTLRATLDWSSHLLSARVRQIFAQLGVFTGSATLDAIERVCGPVNHGDPFDRGDPLAAVTILVEQSLLRSVAGTDGEPRFVMLETIREYALEQLVASGDELTIRARHAAYYLELAEAAVPNLQGPEQMRWLNWLEADHDNLRTACEWYLASDRVEEGLRLVGALHWFWDRRGYFEEGQARIHAALSAQTAKADPSDALLRARASALIGAATLAFDGGNATDVARLAEESAALFRQQGNSRGLVLASLRLAFEYKTDPQRARDLLGAAQQQARASGDPWFIGLALFVSAQAALFGANNTALAQTWMSEAMPALQASGDPYLLAHGMSTLGLIHFATGDLTAARNDFEQGLGLVRALRDRRSIALLAATTADIARCQGDNNGATELYSESLALYHALGNRAEIPAILHNQGYVALSTGDDAAAQDLFAESLRRQHAAGNWAGVAEGLSGLAACALARQQLDRAARLFGAAETLRNANPAPIWPAERFEIDRHTRALGLRMPAARRTQMWHEGQTLSTEQAIAYALAADTNADADATVQQSASQPQLRSPSRISSLTEREREVARLIAQGATNHMIADALVISERTVERHIANIFAKLDLGSRTQIAVLAAEAGLHQSTDRPPSA